MEKFGLRRLWYIVSGNSQRRNNAKVRSNNSETNCKHLLFAETNLQHLLLRQSSDYIVNGIWTKV